MISVQRLTSARFDVFIDDTKLIDSKDNSVICSCKRSNTVWIMTHKDVLEQMDFVAKSDPGTSTIMKDHVSLGHASINQLKHNYGTKFTSEQISRTIKRSVTCASVVSKSNIRKIPTREYEVGEMISADLIGQSMVPMDLSYPIRNQILSLLKFQSQELKFRQRL